MLFIVRRVGLQYATTRASSVHAARPAVYTKVGCSVRCYQLTGKLAGVNVKTLNIGYTTIIRHRVSTP